MNSIILAKLLLILYPDEIVKIYKEREHKSQGYQYLTTKGVQDILENDEDEYLLDSDLRVTKVGVMYDHDYGYVLEIVVKEIDNESK